MSLASLRVCTSEISMIFKIESSNCTSERLSQCCKVKPRSFMIMCKVQTFQNPAGWWIEDAMSS